MYDVRRMSRSELPLAMELAADEGWNPGVHDAEPFHNADSDGFYVGALDGEPIATISAVAYDDAFAFVGFYIVKHEHRGHGYGMRLWQHALSRLTTQNVGLDGVLAQQANYERSGFKLAHRNIRYEGAVARTSQRDPSIVDSPAVPFEQLESYDRGHFPALRAAFLRSWLAQSGVVSCAAVEDSSVRGYGVARPCRRGYKVGPLFADDATSASALLSALMLRLPTGEPLYLDVPAPNTDAVDLAESLRMKPTFETVRMYTRGAPAEGLRGVYGVTSFELG